jgi:hypothetical protein
MDMHRTSYLPWPVKMGLLVARLICSVLPNLPESAVQLEGGFGYASFWHWILQRPNKGPYLYGLATAENMDDYNDCVTLEASAPVREQMPTFLHSTFPHSFRNPTPADILYT